VYIITLMDLATVGALAVVSGIIIGSAIRWALNDQDPVIHEAALVAAAIMATLASAVTGGTITLPLVAGIVAGYLLVGVNNSAPVQARRKAAARLK
jgi:hypothetical protein